ncbi:unnamed protein product [Protopolystoma xenopodis]|uniref:Uncharacterized protein n=1 Tax=Protopolystoma xenopodis TaxID=117903 RepID=A0A448XSG3_9PLAT|nr:unnamed protein product [Protopolystoma xenopodis]
MADQNEPSPTFSNKGFSASLSQNKGYDGVEAHPISPINLDSYIHRSTPLGASLRSQVIVTQKGDVTGASDDRQRLLELQKTSKSIDFSSYDD